VEAVETTAKGWGNPWRTVQIVALGCALEIQADVLRDPKRFQRDVTGEHWCTFAYLQRQIPA